MEEKTRNREHTNVKWIQEKAMVIHSCTAKLAYKILRRITRSLRRIDGLLLLLLAIRLSLAGRPCIASCLWDSTCFIVSSTFHTKCRHFRVCLTSTVCCSFYSTQQRFAQNWIQCFTKFINKKNFDESFCRTFRESCHNCEKVALTNTVWTAQMTVEPTDRIPHGNQVPRKCPSDNW